MSLKIFRRLSTEPASSNVLIHTLAEGVTSALMDTLAASTGYTFAFQREVTGKKYDPVELTASTIAAASNLASDLNAISPMQSLYIADGNYYSAGTITDNGSLNIPATSVGGTPALVNWINGKQAFSFDGANHFTFGDANYDLAVTDRALIIVGDYAALKAGAARIFGGSAVEIEKFVNLHNVGTVSQGKILFDHNIDLTNQPYIFALSLSSLNGTTNAFDHNAVYFNGDIKRSGRVATASKKANTIGKNPNGASVQKIALVAITQGKPTNNQLRRLIKRVEQEYLILSNAENLLITEGDSLTQGDATSAPENRWVRRLINSLETNNTAVFRNYDPAINAQKISNIQRYQRNAGQVLSFTNPVALNKRIAIIWAGTNDLVTDTATGQAVMDNILLSVKGYLKAGIKKIMIPTVIMRTEFVGTNTYRTNRDNFNNLLVNHDFTGLETTYGAKITVAQIHTAPELQDPANATYFSTDQIHPNDAGNLVIHDFFLPLVQTLYNFVAPADTTAPNFESNVLAANNTYVDITFTKGMFRDSAGTLPLRAQDFTLTFTAGRATAASITGITKPYDSGGDIIGNENQIRLLLSITGEPDGTENINIKPSATLYDVFGNAMSATNSINITPFATGNKNATLQLNAGDGGGGSISTNNFTVLDNGLVADGRVVETVTTPGDYEIETDLNATVASKGASSIYVNNTWKISLQDTSNLVSGTTLVHDNSYRYKIKYIHTPTPTFQLQYSTDSGVTWTTFKEGTTNIPPFPIVASFYGQNYAGWGQHTYGNVKVSSNFN